MDTLFDTLGLISDERSTQRAQGFIETLFPVTPSPSRHDLWCSASTLIDFKNTQGKVEIIGATQKLLYRSILMIRQT